jgi:hypothetical protein
MSTLEPDEQPTAADTAEVAEVDSSPAGKGPTLTLKAAARETGVARSTLQRKLKEGQIEGAHRGPRGDWEIPISGLIAAGLAPRTTPADEQPAAADTAEVEQLRAEVRSLRSELEQARTVQQLQARNLDDLREALAAVRMLMPAEDSDTADEPNSEPAPARRWWQRSRS